MSSVLSKAGSKAESQAIALAEHLNIHIKFEEFTKVVVLGGVFVRGSGWVF